MGCHDLAAEVFWVSEGVVWTPSSYEELHGNMQVELRRCAVMLPHRRGESRSSLACWNPWLQVQAAEWTGILTCCSMSGFCLVAHQLQNSRRSLTMWQQTATLAERCELRTALARSEVCAAFKTLVLRFKKLYLSADILWTKTKR